MQLFIGLDLLKYFYGGQLGKVCVLYVKFIMFKTCVKFS